MRKLARKMTSLDEEFWSCFLFQRKISLELLMYMVFYALLFE
jgi:hypothetical protein